MRRSCDKFCVTAELISPFHQAVLWNTSSVSSYYFNSNTEWGRCTRAHYTSSRSFGLQLKYLFFTKLMTSICSSVCTTRIQKILKYKPVNRKKVPEVVTKFILHADKITMYNKWTEDLLKTAADMSINISQMAPTSKYEQLKSFNRESNSSKTAVFWKSQSADYSSSIFQLGLLNISWCCKRISLQNQSI